tara:strand:- start:2091 stop:2288 length:198 start_codon:yes stop_codon:yes gene_type:complete
MLKDLMTKRLLLKVSKKVRQIDLLQSELEGMKKHLNLLLDKMTKAEMRDYTAWCDWEDNHEEEEE